MKYFLSDIAGTVYEIVTGQSFTQRLIRRKVGNVFRRLRGEAPRRSWGTVASTNQASKNVSA